MKKPVDKPIDKMDKSPNKLSDKNSQRPLRIVLVAGGSGGPVTPLLAIAEEISKKTAAEFLLIGTRGGPEAKLAAEKNIQFKAISAGRLRRYFTFKSLMQTVIAPLQSLAGFFQARALLKKFKADAVISAGAFVSVPVGYAAWSLGLPILIHQQDIRATLSNTLLAPIADAITVTFQSSLKDFNRTSGLSSEPINARAKCLWTGNPVRKEFIEARERLNFGDQEWLASARNKFSITDDRPILFITGGGTGAAALNSIILAALPQLLVRFTVIHSTGRDKAINFNHEHYHGYEFISGMAEAFALADIVISRAGIAAITELSTEAKAAIIVPIPKSHQEDNALYLHSKNAALILAQDLLSSERLVSIVTQLLYDANRKIALGQAMSEIMPHDAAQRIAEIALKLCKATKNIPQTAPKTL
jgi:UDP-N-acetylglucosamine--N-acetylmuramyl-(pentapeptide) pyrophosphoryl-undecaprenol N-acetylglucosamine transferase